MTNGDRIRHMTDDELEKFINSVQCCYQFGDEGCFSKTNKTCFCNSVNGNYCEGILDDVRREIYAWIKQESL